MCYTFREGDVGGCAVRRKGKVWLVVLLSLVGAMIGSALWSMLEDILPAALTHAVALGTTAAPITVNLRFIELTFGAVLNVNIGGILGIAIALLISLKL